jgi:hypothetical protein
MLAAVQQPGRHLQPEPGFAHVAYTGQRDLNPGP